MHLSTTHHKLLFSLLYIYIVTINLLPNNLSLNIFHLSPLSPLCFLTRHKKNRNDFVSRFFLLRLSILAKHGGNANVVNDLNDARADDNEQEQCQNDATDLWILSTLLSHLLLIFQNLLGQVWLAVGLVLEFESVLCGHFRLLLVSVDCSCVLMVFCFALFGDWSKKKQQGKWICCGGVKWRTNVIRIKIASEFLCRR